MAAEKKNDDYWCTEAGRTSIFVAYHFCWLSSLLNGWLSSGRLGLLGAIVDWNDYPQRWKMTTHTRK
jgi:hypothetical protein